MSRKTILALTCAVAAGSAASAQAQGLQVPRLPGSGDAVYADVMVTAGPTINPAQFAPAGPQPVAVGFSGPVQPVYGAADLTPGSPVALQSMAPGAMAPGQAFGQPFGQVTNVQPMPIPPVAGPVSAISPQPATAYTTTTIQPAPIVAQQQAQTYTPTYYYYYYQQPYQVTQLSPVTYVDPAGVAAMQSGYANQFGPMSNARGEMGHVRYPYYSYRRPWYFPGQPSFNVTIDGPVW